MTNTVGSQVMKKRSRGILDQDISDSDQEADDPEHTSRVKRVKDASGSVKPASKPTPSTPKPPSRKSALLKPVKPVPASKPVSSLAVHVGKPQKGKPEVEDTAGDINGAEAELTPVKRPRGRPLKGDPHAKPQVEKRPRGRPPNPAPANIQQQLWKALVFVSVTVAPKHQAGKTSRGDKLVPQPPLVRGPFTLTHQMEWKVFMDEVGNTIAVDKENLQVDAMSWGFQRQKDHLPLTSIEAFSAMRSVIKTQKGMSSLVLFVYHPILRSSGRQKQKNLDDDGMQQRMVTDDTHYARKVCC